MDTCLVSRRMSGTHDKIVELVERMRYRPSLARGIVHR